MNYKSNEIPMRLWAEEDKPSIKLRLNGKASLSDTELLAMIISPGLENPLNAARKILFENQNSLNTVAKLTVSELQKYDNIGKERASRIIAAFELGKRRTYEEQKQSKKISDSKECVSLMQPILGDLIHEEFWIIGLNRANHILGKWQISKGGMTGTVADPKMIFRKALEEKVVQIILCHNHPSGNNQPSASDLQLTKNIVESGKVLEIAILDHIIITQHNFYSFADEGLI